MATTFAEVKEKLAAMEGIEADSLSNITFQGRQYADDTKLKDIMSKIKGAQAHDFYTHRRLRGGGVSKKIGKKDREEAVSTQKKGFLDFMMQKAVAKVTEVQIGIKAIDDAKQCMTDLQMHFGKGLKLFEIYIKNIELEHVKEIQSILVKSGGNTEDKVKLLAGVFLRQIHEPALFCLGVQTEARLFKPETFKSKGCGFQIQRVWIWHFAI